MSSEPKEHRPYREPDSVAESVDDSDERDDAVIGRALRWSLLVFLLLGATAGGVTYWLTRSAPPPAVDETPLALPAVRKAPGVEIPDMPFADVTQAAGIEFTHENGAAGDKLLPETMGGGSALFDFDGDGDQDLLLVNSSRWPWDTRPMDRPATMAFYTNDGTGKFTNATAVVGLNVSFYGMGTAAGDYDNDGRADIFISALGRDHLFHNEGGRFVDVTDSAGVAGADDAWGTSCGWFDYDNDGDLDLMVANYLQWTRESDAAQNFQLIGGGRAYGRPQNFGGTYSYLYRNDGGGRFSDVSADSGIQVKNASTSVPMGKGLGLTFVDFDADGWMDIIVANDTVQNFLFHNQGNGTFREMGALSGVAFDIDGNARGAMGIDAAPFRNDDDLGIAIGNFSNEMTALYVSKGKLLQFSDEAVPTGLGPATRLELTFGVFYADVDLDGRLDLLAANGHLEEDINKVQPSQHYAQPPQLFWNCGPEHATEFMPVPAEKVGEDFRRPLVGRGAGYADIDGDGDLDVLITSVGQPARLLRNDQHTGHHWLRLKLVGSSSNRDAIGAWVEVTAGGKTYRRQVMPTRSYLSQVELPVTVGLGNTERADRVTVHWPSGTKTQLDDVPVDRSHEIHETTGLARSG